MALFDPHPLPAFHFRVTIMGNLLTDTSFQEVDGLVSKMETESVAEGGQNLFQHQLPKGISHQNLVLKRGTRFIRVFFLSVVAITIAKMLWSTYH